MSSARRRVRQLSSRTVRRAWKAAQAQLALLDTTGHLCPVCGAWRCPECWALILVPEDHRTNCTLSRWTGTLPGPYIA